MCGRNCPTNASMEKMEDKPMMMNDDDTPRQNYILLNHYCTGHGQCVDSVAHIFLTEEVS